MQLEQFRNFIKYKYPIMSPKRSSREKANAGYVDYADSPSKIETTWSPGMLKQMRESSPTRTRSDSNSL